MKLALFAILTVVHLSVAAFVWLQIVLQCGMGPDSAAACNVQADAQADIFVMAALLAYLLLAIVYWHHRRTKAQ
jgi:hypothetical protein